MLTTQLLSTPNPLRDTITNAYRMDETTCLRQLIEQLSFSPEDLKNIQEVARQIVINARDYKQKQGKIDALLHQYDLSTEEGIALMCLAEALLRIPDKTTIDKFISDKLSRVDWKNHLSSENSLFVNAATWSLIFTGKLYEPILDSQKSLFRALKRSTSRLGITMVRPIIFQMMKAVGHQFVLGQDINTALKNSQDLEAFGYQYSYDMLGEAARTSEDAAHYYKAYQDAIEAIGKIAKHDALDKNPGISVKLSALHPRYEFTQYERLLTEVTPLLLRLAQHAKRHNIGLVVDAEEADRLDLSLDIFERVYKDPSLNEWDGFGLAVQAYQKRAFYVLDWVAALAKQHGRRIKVRLVKGAYWDAEIKMSQVQGLSGYPVFTRKSATDVSYLACAHKMLSLSEFIYSQFGTHNAYSIAAIMQMAGSYRDFEFQCLHGMGRPLYDQIVKQKDFHCRIYAPVGSHQDLLGYLVRRLLENGANSSFLNQLADEKTPIENVIRDPIEYISRLQNKSHPKIPLPKDIYHEWENSQGIDLSDFSQLAVLESEMEKIDKEQFNASSIVNGKVLTSQNGDAVRSPADNQKIIGYSYKATDIDIEHALQVAVNAKKSWEETNVSERAAILERAATLLQNEMPTLITLIMREGGRCIQDCISEVREAIDYCRYYAHRARIDFAPRALPGPTGESNQLSLHPRGVIATISPWNFPIAIFTGQITAALAAGNVVIAKPAEQTPLVAFKTIQLLHQAGVPTNVLQLLIGPGSEVGAKLVSDARVDGVIFTGSTETAQIINQSLANRTGPIPLFIAETGGQNAIIVDSSALSEQAVIDIAQSAFNSAGQRCSAARVLFVQEDIAPKLLAMVKGYIAELNVDDPSLLATDVGPVIDKDALSMLQDHFDKMSNEGVLIAQAQIKGSAKGNFFAPCVFEIQNLDVLKREVFGPILHVIRYKAEDLESVLNAVINTGYGLTLGIQSRIDTIVQYISDKMPVGNVYINRNIIGAVVGVQPFGGERLSGTGPKAGGPHYIPRLCVERNLTINTTAVGGNARLISLHEDD